ncbi:N-acetylmuramoyl-L-alanine amidase [Flavobacterium sp. SOK18b]|uniref:N-acetylmuramoyl-L-alanine amidase family protein n=1 Tax=Flavobacterium sp. SOK18b TaxID=797900 RepID=UPI0015F9F1BC|nr:N-acetylmuramoyl-L-alanine amidase [Flavobacterium sp. SOK18b]MBB1193902.1 N-acetylmuramoyl-L-alanine amidase [Flavobacterium sp. SOK18b]
MSFSSNNKLLVSFILLMNSVLGFSQSSNFKVTLDAGHGAHDFGAVYEGRIEKNIALAVVLKVGKILESTPYMEVNYTRKTDVFIDLIERANIANRFNANIFVSIHCNANRNTLADGTETYVMGLSKVSSNLEAAKKENSVITLEKDYKQKYEGFDPNSPETMIGMTLMQEEYLDNSISLASKVEDAFENLGKKIRGEGVKQAPFMVLHKAYMPRVLIEMGFISNTIEGNILNSEEGQNQIAKAISDAIISYKAEYYGTNEIENIQEVLPQDKIEKPINEINETPTTPNIQSGVNPAAVLPVVNGSASTVYKVQLMASLTNLDTSSKTFRGLDAISVITENKYFKYLYGNTTDYEAAKKDLKIAKEKGFSSAFLIAYKNGEKVSIKDALK